MFDSQTWALQAKPCPCGHALLGGMNLGSNLIKYLIRSIHNVFQLKNSPWKWGTMAQGGHGAKVLYGPIRWPTPSTFVL